MSPVLTIQDVVVRVQLAERPYEEIRATTPEELELEMRGSIKKAEDARRAIARAIVARGGRCDFSVQEEQEIIHHQITRLKKIEQIATQWLSRFDGKLSDIKARRLVHLESAAAATSTLSSVMDIVMSGAKAATICSGVSSGIQGISSASSKYIEWKMNRLEVKIGRLHMIKARSIRNVTDLTEALAEYRGGIIEKGSEVMLSPRALWAGRLVYLMFTKKRKRNGDDGEMEIKETVSEPRSFAREILPIPEIPYIGPIVEDWIKMKEEAIGAGRAIRKVALQEKKRGMDEESGYEKVAFELYRQIKILDRVVELASGAYKEPHPLCGMARERCILKSTMVCENVAWAVNWFALISLFVSGYSAGATAIKLVANVGQGGASYISGSVLRWMLEKTKKMIQIKNLLEEAKRERESFYLTLLSYYPHLEEDEVRAVTISGRASQLEAKMSKMVEASPGEVPKDLDRIALRLLIWERDKGVNLEELPFKSSIAGLILTHMRDYAIRFPHRSLSDLLGGDGSIGSRWSDSDSPPRIEGAA